MLATWVYFERPIASPTPAGPEEIAAGVLPQMARLSATKYKEVPASILFTHIFEESVQEKFFLHEWIVGTRPTSWDL
jgi:hypothetical protein